MAPVTSNPDDEAALAGLARTIRTRRSDCPPHETARQLLEYDRPGHVGLVGVRYDARRAVLHHEGEGYAVGIEFGPDGLGDGGPVVAEFDGGTTVHAWVRRMRCYWGWVHPRYR